jgi:hypothetical protein
VDCDLGEVRGDGSGGRCCECEGGTKGVLATPISRLVRTGGAWIATRRSCAEGNIVPLLDASAIAADKDEDAVVAEEDETVAAVAVCCACWLADRTRVEWYCNSSLASAAVRERGACGCSPRGVPRVGEEGTDPFEPAAAAAAALASATALMSLNSTACSGVTNNDPCCTASCCCLVAAWEGDSGGCGVGWTDGATQRVRGERASVGLRAPLIQHWPHN